jgi:hypothetical protein
MLCILVLQIDVHDSIVHMRKAWKVLTKDDEGFVNHYFSVYIRSEGASSF